MDDLLAQTRILLMPSLWHEGFGLTVMEAMLRGIPAVASDAGGLPEAKRGTGYVIPVRPIERYLPEFDEQAMPRPVLPENEIEPWVEAVEELLGDRAEYERESAAARAAAMAFVRGAGCRRVRALSGRSSARQSGQAGSFIPPIESLSPEKARAAAGTAAAADRIVDAHSAGAKFALLPGPRRRR